MKRNILGFGLLFGFYGILGFLIFGRFVPALLWNGLFMIFVVLSSLIPIGLLSNDDIVDQHYDKNNVILAVNITHIILVVAFIVFVIVYQRFLGEISPITGFIVFGLSYIVHFVALGKDLTKRWVIMALVFHTIVFILFINYGSIHFTILVMAFIFIVIQEIFVVSYGVLRHIEQF